MLKFFKNPFAVSGTRSAIPATDPGTGEVNYPSGYTPPYQLPKTDPSSRNIERDKMNQLFFDVTNELQLLQANGVPDFITTALNEGSPFEYNAGAVVRYDDGVNGPRVFVSLIDANTDLPTVAASWRPARLGGLPVAVAAGTANALTAAFTPTLGLAPNGTAFILRHALENSGPVTLAVDGGAATAVVKGNDLPLTAGDIAGLGSWGLYVFDTTLSKYVLLNPANGAYGQNVISGVPRQLSVRTSAGTPNTIVDVAAAELTVRNAAGRAIRLSAVAVSANITVSGAGGLDTGVEAINTWYYIHVIHNATTGTTAALLSVSASAPTLPSGFAFSALVGVVRNDAAGNFRQFKQRGATVMYVDRLIVLAGGAATVLTAIDISAAVPPVASSVEILVTKQTPAALGQSVVSVYARNAATSAAIFALGYSGGSSQNGYGNGDLLLDWPDSAPNIWYLNSNGSADISVNGFRLQSAGAIG